MKARELLEEIRALAQAEADGWQTVHPAPAPTAAVLVEANIGRTTERALECGVRPLRAIVSVRDYRALAAARPLEPRHIGQAAATCLRVRVCGFDLVVDCDGSVPDNDAHVTSTIVPFGRA